MPLSGGDFGLARKMWVGTVAWGCAGALPGQEEFSQNCWLVRRLLNQETSMSQHILVVDDEAQIRDLLCIYLMKQGFKVSTASNTRETLAILAKTPVDLTVLDIGLGDEDGLKLL